ncbi:MAG: nucleotidyltransferase family protein [Chitinophagaceae bacterium]
MKAMILAAGLGTRLKPWTDHHPKALAQVNGKPLLQHNIEYLQRHGIQEVIVNVHHFADQIIEAITLNNGWKTTVTVSDETDAVLETGGGLKKASWFFDTGDFVLMNVDVLTDMNLKAMISHHRKHQCLATLAVTNRATSRYFLFDEEHELCGWKNIETGEKKLVHFKEKLVALAFSGIHVLNPSVFSHITREGKFSMVDVYLELARQHRVKGFDHSGSAFIDVGKPESLVKAEQLFI